MRKKKRKKHTKIITKIVLVSGILIGGGIGIVTIMNCNAVSYTQLVWKCSERYYESNGASV